MEKPHHVSDNAPVPPELPSGPRQLTMLFANDVRVLVGACVVAVAVSFAVFFALDARAQKAVDAGVDESAKKLEVVAQKSSATQDELTRFQGESDRRMTRVENSVMRQDQKLDALLDAFKIRNPAPAPPLVLDGGH